MSERNQENLEQSYSLAEGLEWPVYRYRLNDDFICRKSKEIKQTYRLNDFKRQQELVRNLTTLFSEDEALKWANQFGFLDLERGQSDSRERRAQQTNDFLDCAKRVRQIRELAEQSQEQQEEGEDYSGFPVYALKKATAQELAAVDKLVMKERDLSVVPCLIALDYISRTIEDMLLGASIRLERCFAKDGTLFIESAYRVRTPRQAIGAALACEICYRHQLMKNLDETSPFLFQVMEGFEPHRCKDPRCGLPVEPGQTYCPDKQKCRKWGLRNLGRVPDRSKRSDIGKPRKKVRPK